MQISNGTNKQPHTNRTRPIKGRQFSQEITKGTEWTCIDLVLFEG